MPNATVLGLLLCLGIFLIPAWLLRQQKSARAQDFFVAAQRMPPAVIANSSVAYALRMASFGAFFVLGARGDFWPVIVSAIFFGLGVSLIYLLRQPLLAFLADALSRDGSVTVHEFIARQCGGDARVRLLTAALTLIALPGLVLGEAFAVASFLQPVLPVSAASIPLLMLGLLIAAAACTLLAGQSGVMHSAQLQLGILYLGLFGEAAVLLYLHVSALTPLPPPSMLAVVVLAGCSAALMFYRRSKYIDTGLLKADEAQAHARRGAPLLRRFEKILNACISVFAVIAIVVALMEFYFAGIPALVHGSTAALRSGTHMPVWGLIALALLPLLYPIVDVANWQRIAAAQKNDAPHERPATLRKILSRYAVETPLLWLFIAMFGAIAVVAVKVPAGPAPVQAFIGGLIAEQNLVTDTALWLLLISLLAMALPAMSAMFSASLCILRYDIMPAWQPRLAAGRARPVDEHVARWQTAVGGVALYLFAFVPFVWTSRIFPLNVTSLPFLGLLFAFCCGQLSFAPLILSPVFGRTNGKATKMSAGWALGILGFGTASGLAAVIVFFATGSEAWLWAAVPVCVGSGHLLLAVAWLWPAKPTRRLR